MQHRSKLSGRVAAVSCAALAGALFALPSSCGSSSDSPNATSDGGVGSDGNAPDAPIMVGNDSGTDGIAPPPSDAGRDAIATDGASGCLDPSQFPPPPPATATFSSSCSAPMACGGTLDGTYALESICLSQTAMFKGVTDICSNATFTGVTTNAASGALSVAGGTLTLELHAGVSAIANFPNNCLFCQCGLPLESALLQRGVDASCSPVCDNGACSCTVNGTVDIAESGAYTTTTTSFTTVDKDAWDYCSSTSGISIADPSGKLGVASFTKQTTPGPEKCDGVDNDLDGVIDDDPRDCSSCSQKGVCAGSASTCKGAAGWECTYPATYQQYETKCDGLDNDCNGTTDDEPQATDGCIQAKGANYICSNGACTCSGKICGNACIDTSGDENNCGACGTVCPSLATCNNGQCTCPASAPSVCGASCVDTQSDAANCGMCGNACPSGASCSAGKCQCPASAPNVCNGACTDLTNDAANCGSCMHSCNLACSSGNCIGVAQLSVGQYTSFARLTDGTARGWGLNSQGDLGNGTTFAGASTKATPVVGLSNVAGVARGGRCAWLTNGSPFCWGADDFGQLGDGMTTMETKPMPVPGLTNVAGMAAGSDFTCAWTASGAAYCWGDGTSSQLGTGGGSPTMPLVGIPPIAEIACGLQHTCARTTTGSVYCWGSNIEGQCGSGSFGGLPGPTQVMGLSQVTQIVTGDLHSCALTMGGSVYCWGHNQYGAIGDGTNTDRNAPTAVLVSLGGGSLAGVVQIGAGSDFTCARLVNGTVECWGWNQDAELGDGTTMSSPSPVVAKVTSNAQDLAVGGEHVCVRLPDGNVQCWGNDTFGEAPSKVSW